MLAMTRLVIGYRSGRRFAGAFPLIAPITLAAKRGELVCVMGTNGCGKSTLLRTIAGLLAPLDGMVTTDDRNVHAMRPYERARQISMVATRPIVPRWMTVRELVSLGRMPYRHCRHRFNDWEIVTDAMRQTEILAHAAEPVHTLSDGRLQRAFIARALTQQTPLMLLDEPTAFLDPQARTTLFICLRRIAEERLVVCATHDIAFAKRYADRLLLCVDDHHSPMRPRIVDLSPSDSVCDATLATVFGNIANEIPSEQSAD